MSLKYSFLDTPNWQYFMLLTSGEWLTFFHHNKNSKENVFDGFFSLRPHRGVHLLTAVIHDQVIAVVKDVCQREYVKSINCCLAQGI